MSDEEFDKAGVLPHKIYITFHINNTFVSTSYSTKAILTCQSNLELHRTYLLELLAMECAD
jgi:hypothetical protein